MDDNALFFVTGIPKSGTTLLARLIDTHKDATVLNETHFLRANIFPRIKDKSYDSPLTVSNLHNHSLAEIVNKLATRIKEVSVLEDDLALKRLSELSLQYYNHYREKADVACVGEKSPKYTFHHKEILKLFPHAKIISIVRHPFAVYASTKDFVPNELNVVQKSIFRLKKKFKPSKKLNPMFLMERWKRYAQECGKETDEACLVVRYEDLLSAPDACMERVYKHLKLQPDDRYKNHCQVSADHKFDHVKKASKKLDPSTIYRKAEKLSGAEINNILSVVGEKLKVFNYGDNLSSIASL